MLLLVVHSERLLGSIEDTPIRRREGVFIALRAVLRARAE
jgi:hypothetical protein